MTSRVTLPPQDFNKMCKQAERDLESKKLVVLMERVKRQIAERESLGTTPKHPVIAIDSSSSSPKLPSRSALFER